MTRGEALTELRAKQRKAELSGLPLQIDEGAMFVFLPEPDEHRDYGMFRAVENAPGEWSVEKLLDADGNTSLTRAWYTPREWAEKHGDAGHLPPQSHRSPTVEATDLNSDRWGFESPRWYGDGGEPG